MINIFLDSTCLYEDPFLKTTFSKLFLERISSNTEIKVHISEVVYTEIINNHLKAFDTSYKKLEQALGNFNLNVTKASEITINKPENKFKEFYKKLQEDNIINFIELKIDIVRNSLERQYKDNNLSFFLNKKKEFKDAFIWFSYIDYIKTNAIKDVIFISGNHREFWDESKKDLHPSLKEQNINFKIYESIKDLIDKEKTIFGIEEYRDKINIQEIVEEKAFDHFRRVTEDYIGNMAPIEFNQLAKQPAISSGDYLEVEPSIGIDDFKVNIIDKVSQDKILVSGTANVNTSVTSFYHVPDKDVNDFPVNKYETSTSTIYSFYLNPKNKELSDVEINVDDIKVDNVVSYFEEGHNDE
jgi:hypothetical protein